MRFIPATPRNICIEFFIPILEILEWCIVCIVHIARQYLTRASGLLEQTTTSARSAMAAATISAPTTRGPGSVGVGRASGSTRTARRVTVGGGGQVGWG